MNIEGLEIRVKYGATTYWKNGVVVGRKCTECKEDKEIGEFDFIKARGSYRAECKKCKREKTQKWRKSNPDKVREGKRKWQKNNPKYSKQRHQNYKEKNLQHISGIVERISPIMKELPIYGYIYKFENIKTGKVYIGQTIQPLKARYKANITQGWIKDRLEYKNQKFKEELIEEDFKITELFDVAFCQYHLDKLEAHWINYYDSCKNGYNNNAGHHGTTDGLEEFNQILSDHNLEFKDGKLIQIKAPTQK